MLHDPGDVDDSELEALRAAGVDIVHEQGFDLVSAHYASIPRTPDGRGVRNLLDAVARVARRSS